MIKALNVKEKVLKRNITRALSDEYSRKMIECVIIQGRSVNEMSRLCNIPLNTTYRRARELVAQGLLVVDRTMLTDKGVKYDIYRSSLRSFKVEWSPPEEVIVDVQPVEDAIRKFIRVWNSLRTIEKANAARDSV